MTLGCERDVTALRLIRSNRLFWAGARCPSLDRMVGRLVELENDMSMTDEQIKTRLNAVRKTAESLHGAGYSYDSGAPSEACWDVRWLLAHIDGLNLALNDAKVRLRVLGDSLGIERWLGQHKYRTVMHRRDGGWRAVDEASQLRLDADTFEELAEMLATLADGHELTMAKPPNAEVSDGESASRSLH